MRKILVLAALALCACVSLAGAEVVQKGPLRVSFDGQIAPTTLPRDGRAPITVKVGGEISTTNRSLPPQLREIQIAINREGQLDARGLPACRYDDLQPSTTAKALESCGGARIGEGTFSANVAIPGQAPFPSEGKMIAFNGTENGKPMIYAHVYGTKPVPTSYTLPFTITRAKGAYATVLTSRLPQVTTDVGFITGLSLTLGKRFRYRGEQRSYLSAGCPAPKGFPGATFGLARTTFAFAGGKKMSKVLSRSCRARG